MIPIEDNKRVDWNAIRAEYIGGNISQRKLSEKHGISFNTLKDRANAEGWATEREKVHHKTAQLTQQRMLKKSVNNADLAADIKKRLLLRLQRIEKKYPLDATEVRAKKGENVVIFRLRDLTAAYKDLTEDLTSAETDKNAPIYALLKRLDDECGV